MSNFQMKFEVRPDLLAAPSKRRSGLSMAPGVRFIVAHDTGMPRSTARGNVRHYQNTVNLKSASAHLFVDDREIIECIPALTGPPEKAWHVRYDVPQDDKLYGLDANDAAVGVEYCYGDNIDADRAYQRYVWVIALACHRFNLNPQGSVVGHWVLDPQRRTDPMTGLAASLRSYEQLLLDIVTEFEVCTGIAAPPPVTPPPPGTQQRVRLRANANIRRGQPARTAPIARSLPAGTEVTVTGLVSGERVNGIADWYSLTGNEFLWSGVTLGP